MRLYEVVYIFDPALTEEDITAKLEKYHELYPGSWGEFGFRTDAGCYSVRSEGETILVDTGLGPGPHVGRALARLTDGVLEDPSRNTPEGLRALLAGFAAEEEQEG